MITNTALSKLNEEFGLILKENTPTTVEKYHNLMRIRNDLWELIAKKNGETNLDLTDETLCRTLVSRAQQYLDEMEQYFEELEDDEL